MPLQEGHTYLHGRLAAGWEQKSTPKGDLLWENRLAYQPTKDDETIWIDLAIWPYKDGSTAAGDAVAGACGKGDMVLVRGVVKTRTFFSKKHNEERTGYSLSVYDLGVRPRYEVSGGSQVASTTSSGSSSAKAALEHARRPFDLEEDEEPF